MINRILMRISVVVEPDDKKFFGWSPDLDGVLVKGDTIKETKSLLKDLIEKTGWSEEDLRGLKLVK